MRIYKYLTLLITCCLLGSGCESDCDWVRPDGDFSEGRVSVRLQVSDASVIQTRAGDNVSEEAIENVTLLVYKKREQRMCLRLGRYKTRHINN